jgi:sarcosine oxidase
MSADVIIVGLGAHGSAAAYHLAARSAQVVGLDAFAEGHTLGSSGGQTRTFHLAPGPDDGGPARFALLQRARELWLRLQHETGEQLLLETGYLSLGPGADQSVAQDLADAKRYGLEHDVLDVGAVQTRYPVFDLDVDWKGIFFHQAGVLWCERAIAALQRLARRHSADLRFGERVMSWSERDDKVEVRTERETYTASRLVVAAGAWNRKLLPAIAPYLQVERVEQFWFEPTDNVDAFSPERLPTFNVSIDDAAGVSFQGFPYFASHGMKILRYEQEPNPGYINADADALDRQPSSAGEAKLRADVLHCMPSAAGALRAGHVCMYTHTPDREFVIGRYPGAQRTVVCSACSGAGFGCTPVIGEILADIAERGVSRHDIGSLSPDRFAAAGTSSFD